MREAKKYFVLLVLLVVIANFGFFHAVATPVLAQSKECSPASTTSTRITFVNQTKRIVSIYWINFECQEEYYSTLPPGRSYAQESYTNHRWVVRDATTDEFVAGPFFATFRSPITVNIKEAETVTATTSPNAPALTATEVSVTSGPVNCTISTDQRNTVAVRVGPGLNRTTIAFLPADQEFQVLGQGQADDDSKWWKLDKNEVAPKKSANEVWVAQDEVTATGNCDQVADVNAPPIIPINDNDLSTCDVVTITIVGDQWIFKCQ